MKGLNDAYVESIIKKSKDGKLPPGRRRQSSTKQYVNRLKKAYAEKGANICSKYSRAWRSICLDPNQPHSSRFC